VVRRGAGNDYKIIAMVKDGTAVEFLEEGSTHAKIRLANGKEGWVVKRFLSVDAPLEEVVASLRIENETMAEKEIAAKLELEAVNATLSQTEQVLNATIAERDTLQSNYLTLQKDTADVIRTKKDLQQTLKNNKVLSLEMATLQQENDTLKNSLAMKWFLAGGGVLLLGIILGGIFCRSRKRRKPSLL
jgi:SH3 domain protein